MADSAALVDPERGEAPGSAQAEPANAIPRAAAVPESMVVPRVAHFLEPPGFGKKDKPCEEGDEIAMPMPALCMTWSLSTAKVFASESATSHLDRGVYDLSAVDLTYKVRLRTPPTVTRPHAFSDTPNLLQ